MVEPCLEPGHDLIRGEMFSPSTGRGALEWPAHLRLPSGQQGGDRHAGGLGEALQHREGRVLADARPGEIESAAAIPCRHPLSGHLLAGATFLNTAATMGRRGRVRVLKPVRHHFRWRDATSRGMAPSTGGEQYRANAAESAWWR
jgi:hypothetical protein